ncbi:methyl-accepting chemotaxis protein [Maridesulfovibrio hydrothermalis]|uniref:Methyl-accepting chemotaxis sensory transducer n=1 Tax=Maridesulfovibrio hydrothermalis AM13 = DSM 14728 TaxID=1121451 RepID=L0RGU0_9BACT|nr:methyl-accepting chemotaxis protein [Maridesulfovibrio hydrothermalis]CCO25415.1 Methyl-accepting chemotaxis sensory transducer [Maridesulfovibrio hydrothermalis AM13 = DSM 14728]
MLKRLTVGQKIFCSFLVVFLLFVIVGTESLVALKKSSSGFTDYRNLAKDSNLLGEIQAEILQGRTYVKDYIITGDNKYRQKYVDSMNTLQPQLKLAEETMISDNRKALVIETTKMLAEFNTSFTAVAKAQKKREVLANDSMIPEGNLMEQTFEQIIDNLGKTGKNAPALYWCAKGVRNLVLGRLYAAKYLEISDDLHALRSLAEMEKLQSAINQLSNILSKSDLQKLERIRQASEEYVKAMTDLVTTTEYRDRLINSELDVMGPKMADLIEKAKSSVISDQEKLGPNLQSRNDRAISNVYIISFFAFAIGIGAAFAIGRDITRPLRKVVDAAYRIAEGDMTKTIDGSDRKDELGSLAMAFNKMTSSLNEMAKAMERVADSDLTVTVEPRSENDTIGKALAVMVENLKGDNLKINEAVRALSSSLSQISAASAELTASAAETASAVAETNATVEEVKQTAHLSNEKSRQVADVARKAVSTSQQGKKAAEDAASGMKNIRTQMDTIAQSIVKLSEQSQHIGDIIYVVNDIADQSNILAVNASIEASKAGEEGRGFTVVAREIRNLSDQSKHSVSQIQSILADIQKATSSAVMITEEGGKAVETGGNLSSQTGEAILNLSTVVNQSAQSSAQIAASSQEQLAGLDQVAVALGSIKQAGEQNLESSRQLEEAVRDLDLQARSLKNMMDRFKL